MEEIKRVGFAGLGNMGLPMAENLLNAGYELLVWNRTAEKAGPLSARGARLVQSPGEAAAAGIVITMLADDGALEGACFGTGGIIAGLEKGGIHISMSTISVDLARRLAAAHAEAGQLFVTAPVMGRPDAARAAKLRVLTAGPAEAKRRAAPILEALGQQVLDFGEESYKGIVVKLGMNFMIAAMLESLAQAQGFTAKHDVEPAAFMEIVNAFFQSPPYQNYGKLMIEGDFQPGFKMKLGIKDVNLALSAGRGAGAALPLGETAAADFTEGVAAGRGDLDWTALALKYRE
jgi:3-hydroxyisobutyrate dehydrogenase-like beta-hydroxyacid dehydrogenase